MEGSGEFHSQCASSEVRSFVVSFPDHLRRYTTIFGVGGRRKVLITLPYHFCYLEGGVANE